MRTATGRHRARYTTAGTRPSRSELTTLFETYHQHRDPAIREVLVQSHIGLAVALANRFAARQEPADDLQQAAMVGLLHAIDRYDPTRGVQFTTFAWATISGELKRHFRDRTWGLRVPRRVQEHYLVTSEAIDTLTATLGRSPTVAELAHHTQLETEQVLEALDARRAHRVGSLDARAAGADGTTIDLGDVERGYAQVEERHVLSDLVERLSPREREVIQLRYTDEMTQGEIARKIGVSQMHVSRLLAQTMARLREWAEPVAS